MNSAADLRARERIERAAQQLSSELNLSGLGLKSVPDLPAELRGLKKLNLSGNRLKELPPQIWQLAELESLDIGNNRLSALAPEIGQLANLRLLDVSENQLRVLPLEIFTCRRLEQLHLYSNQLTALFAGASPEYARLEHLWLLDLSRNALKSPSRLNEQFPGLRRLELNWNGLEIVPAGTGNLKSLEVLNLSDNRIASLEGLIDLPRLEELYIDDNLLATFPSEVLNFADLKLLSTEGNPFATQPGAFGATGTASMRHDARAAVEAHVSGDPEPGKEYVSAPTYKFDFALGIGGIDGALKVTDLYYKRTDASSPARLIFPDGAVVNLGNVSRKTAMNAVNDHEDSLQTGQALLEIANVRSERGANINFVAEAISRLRASELIPKTPGDQVIQFANPSIAPRYADVVFYIEDDAQGGVRAGVLDADRPLQVDRWYQVEIAVRRTRTGIPATSDHPILEPKQSQAVKVLVAAESPDFDIPEPASELTLGPSGDSTENAYLRIRPRRASSSPVALSKIRVQLLYQLQLLEIFTIEAEVAKTDTAQSQLGLARPAYLSPERFCQTEPSGMELLKPRILHILVDRRDDAYTFTFTTQIPGFGKVAVTGPAWLKPQQLEPVIVGARKALMGVAASSNLAVNIDGDDSEYRQQLAALADCGSQLWTQLFSMDPQSALSKIGQWLRDTPPVDGSSIQISITRNAADFVFPWALLYDQPFSDQEAVREDGFWGLRYIIEQRIIMPKAAEQPIAAPPLEVGLLMWRFKQAKDQAEYLAQLVAQAKATLSAGSPIMDLATAQTYMRNCTANILYFFTHGHTQLPDTGNFGFSAADFVGLYEKLDAASPLKEDWKYTYESIKSRQYKSDRSWIEVGKSPATNGFLYLQDLYASIHALAGQPIVILNMCESAQITPSLSMSFIHFFLTRGARAVTGTECPMRPTYADYVGREMIQALLQGDSVGTALRNIRLESVRRKNPLGLAYTVFGSVDARLEQALLAKPCQTASGAIG